MKPQLILPSETGTGADLARQFGALLGPAIRWASGTVAGALLLALGDALALSYTTVLGAGDEAFATSALNLLSELETEYGLPVDTTLTTADRRNRLVAKIRAARSGSPQGILNAVSRLDPSATIAETTCAEADAVGAPRKAFHFTLFLASSVFDDAIKVSTIRTIVEQMKPAHTQGDVGDGSPFTLDDATLGRLTRNGLG